ncbi:hypothetical protein K523DRAFT_376581 [Schizophyllum commune Tattone D]|nr:hypothetical protein K523DRAFT_376581 [Schizophyllum commune Tattone D]
MSCPSDNDSLFGSPPSSPRSPSPGLALPSAHNIVRIPGAPEDANDENVGTIALPALSLSHAPRPPAQDHGRDTAAAPAKSTAQQDRARQPEAPVPPARGGTKRARRAASPGPSRPRTTTTTTTRKRRRPQSPRPSVPTIAPGDAPSRPIIVEDHPHLDPRLPVPTTAEIVQTLMNTKEVLPLLLRTLLLVARSPHLPTAATSPSGSATPSDRPRRRRIGPSLKDAPPPPPPKDPSNKGKRKLTKVPAGAQDWDVPFPFQEGEGPEDYQQKWEKQRTRRLIGQLINLIKAAAKKTAVRKYKQMKLDGTLPPEDEEPPRPPKRPRKTRKNARDPTTESSATPSSGAHTPLPAAAAALHINGSAPDTNGSLDQLLTSLLSHGGSGVNAGVFGADGLFETPSGTPAPTECDDFTSLIQSTFPSDGFDYNALWMNAGMSVDANGMPLDSNGVPMNMNMDAGMSMSTGVDMSAGMDAGAPMPEMSFEELTALFASDENCGLGLDGLGMGAVNVNSVDMDGLSVDGVGIAGGHGLDQSAPAQDYSFPLDPALMGLGQAQAAGFGDGAMSFGDGATNAGFGDGATGTGSSSLMTPSPTDMPSMSMSASASSAGDGPYTPLLDQEQLSRRPSDAFSVASCGFSGTSAMDNLQSAVHTSTPGLGLALVPGIQPDAGAATGNASSQEPITLQDGNRSQVGSGLPSYVGSEPSGDGNAASPRNTGTIDPARQNVFSVVGNAPEVELDSSMNLNLNMDVDWTGGGEGSLLPSRTWQDSSTHPLPDQVTHPSSSSTINVPTPTTPAPIPTASSRQPTKARSTATRAATARNQDSSSSTGASSSSAMTILAPPTPWTPAPPTPWTAVVDKWVPPPMSPPPPTQRAKGKQRADAVVGSGVATARNGVESAGSNAWDAGSTAAAAISNAATAISNAATATGPPPASTTTSFTGPLRMPVTAAEKARVLQQARERKAELEGAIERAKVELWELSIEGDVLHRVRKKMMRIGSEEGEAE